TPIVCYSAHVFSQDKMNALNAGADIFLAKPVSKEILVETIEKALHDAENIHERN
ncbi:MAG: DNA-binding response regulator, partial [Ignavibacteria bacterium CG08_land_8_20_14_0_20_37_9]